jgi:hypothetical protein
MDEADDGTGKTAGTGATPNQHEQQIELLTKSVGLLAEGLQKMEGNQSEIIATLAKVTEQSKGEVRQELEHKFGEGVDLEQLDRKDFAAFIMENTAKALRSEMTKLLEGVESKVTNLATSFESKNANEQISKTAHDNPDFWEWSGEIKNLLKENPTLTVNRAYNLARSENKDKVKELDTKYAKPVAKKEQSFLGLTPTSSVGARDGTGKMSQREAAEKAFDKVMGELGDVLQNGDMKIA